MKILCTVIAATMLVLLAACSQIDPEKGEAQIKQMLEKNGIKVVGVDCPENIKAKQGETFECMARLAGQADLPVTVEQLDNEGNVRFGTRGIVIAQLVEQGLVETAKSRGADLKVDCGERVRKATTGETFECKATSKTGETENIKIEVTDDKGSWKVP
jgi:hypothetical protein